MCNVVICENNMEGLAIWWGCDSRLFGTHKNWLHWDGQDGGRADSMYLMLILSNTWSCRWQILIGNIMKCYETFQKSIFSPVPVVYLQAFCFRLRSYVTLQQSLSSLDSCSRYVSIYTIAFPLWHRMITVNLPPYLLHFHYNSHQHCFLVEVIISSQGWLSDIIQCQMVRRYTYWIVNPEEIMSFGDIISEMLTIHYVFLLIIWHLFIIPTTNPSLLSIGK